MREQLRHRWRETLRSLWFVPMVFIVAALIAGAVLSRIEIAESGLVGSLVFRGTAAAARELLIVVSGTMITVTGLVFVLTVVALQIASTQFSVRLLRSFLQDPGTRLVLGVFVATFAYSLGGLFTVGQETETGDPFVPRLAVTGSLILALVSVGMLVYYIQHITNSIRIDRVMLGVRRATLRAIRTVYPRPVTVAHSLAERPSPTDDAFVVLATRSGYVQDVDIDRLLELARTNDLCIRLRQQVGHHVVAGTPLAWVWGDGAFPDPTVLGDAVDRAVLLTHERRVDDDVGFGVRQLVDIALRAVAPSMNDPYTAVQATQHLAIVIAELALVATDDIVLRDDRRLRVFVPVPGFELFLDVVCSNLRESAADRPRVMVELLRLLEVAAMVGTTPARRAAIAHQVDRVLRAAERCTNEATDLEWVRTQAARAAAAARNGVKSADAG